jgi:hypothetical protein
MRANGRHAKVREGSLLVAAMLLLVVAACSNTTPLDPETDGLAARGRAGQADEIRFTGTVDMMWPGGKGMNAPDDDRYAQASLAAFPGVAPGSPGSGNFAYRVIASAPPEDCGSCHENPPAATEQHPFVDDGMLHREIGVRLFYVNIDTEADTVRFLGEVVSDTKPCGGSGPGSGGCSGHDGGTHDDGGCSHDDGTTHDDGGCSHDDGTTHDEGGGCSHDDGTTHDEGGGCSGGGSTGGHGEPGGPGGSGSHPNGSDCRIGQVVIGWAFDSGSRGVDGDRISWKWFYPDAPKVSQIRAAIEAGDEIVWPCNLCEKEIIGGNLKLITP